MSTEGYSLLPRWHLNTSSSGGDECRGLIWWKVEGQKSCIPNEAYFTKALIPFTRKEPLAPNHLLLASHLHTTALEIKFQHVLWRDTNI